MRKKISVPDPNDIPPGVWERRIAAVMQGLVRYLWPLCALAGAAALFCDIVRLARLPAFSLWTAGESLFTASACLFLAWQSRDGARRQRDGDALFALMIWAGILLYWYRVQTS